jgi:hypothetical protein
MEQLAAEDVAATADGNDSSRAERQRPKRIEPVETQLIYNEEPLLERVEVSLGDTLSTKHPEPARKQLVIGATSEPPPVNSTRFFAPQSKAARREKLPVENEINPVESRVQKASNTDVDEVQTKTAPVASSYPSAQQPKVLPVKAIVPASIVALPRVVSVPAERQRAPELPAIHVSIGRVEVRALVTPDAKPRREAAGAGALSLEDYLRRRAEGGRR